MNKFTIWKEELKLEHGQQVVRLPEEHRIISCGVQDKKPVIWIEVDAYCDHVIKKLIHVCFTGSTYLANKNHVGTVQIDGIVLHIYEQVQADS